MIFWLYLFVKMIVEDVIFYACFLKYFAEYGLTSIKAKTAVNNCIAFSKMRSMKKSHMATCGWQGLRVHSFYIETYTSKSKTFPMDGARSFTECSTCLRTAIYIMHHMK